MQVGAHFLDCGSRGGLGAAGALGYSYVALELKGYRSGTMNEGLIRPPCGEPDFSVKKSCPIDTTSTILGV